MFCKHTWKILDKTVIPSRYQVYIENRIKLEGKHTTYTFPIEPNDMTHQYVIITCTCEKCGKLKVIRESN